MNTENQKIKNQKLMLKYHFPFLSDDVLHALLMMAINFMGNRIPFMLVGSIAWKALGLPLNREIKNIDMEIICDDEEKLSMFEEICKKQEGQSHVTEFNDDDDFGKLFVFTLFGVEFHIWVRDRKKGFYHKKFLTCGGIIIPTVDEVIEIKMRNRRLKDLEDLLELNRIFYKNNTKN